VKVANANKAPKAANASVKKSRNPLSVAERTVRASRLLNTELEGRPVKAKDLKALTAAIGTNAERNVLKAIIEESTVKLAKPEKAEKAGPKSMRNPIPKEERSAAAVSLLAPTGIAPTGKNMAALVAAIGTGKEESVLEEIMSRAVEKTNKASKKLSSKAELARQTEKAHSDLLMATGEEPSKSNVDRLAAIRHSGSSLSVADYLMIKKHAATRKKKGPKANLTAAEFQPIADACDQCRMKLMLMNDPAERTEAIERLGAGITGNAASGRSFVYNNTSARARSAERANRSMSKKARERNIRERLLEKAAINKLVAGPITPYRKTQKQLTRAKYSKERHEGGIKGTTKNYPF